MPELTQSGVVPPRGCTDCGVVPFITHTATELGLLSNMSSPSVLLKFPVPSMRKPDGTGPREETVDNAPDALVCQMAASEAGLSFWNRMSERPLLLKSPYCALS